MEKTTKKKTALITGGSRGLGLAIARTLAARGWSLIIDGRDALRLDAAERELAKTAPVIAIAGDVGDADHRRQLAAAAAERGPIDALINNAGTLGPSPLPALVDYPLDALADVFRVNALAPLGVIQAVQPYLVADARIINVTSDAGAEAYPGWGGYGSSKAALDQLSAVLAVEQPEWRVYSVDPGDMRTEMHQAAFAGEDITDRPLPSASVPGFVALIEGVPARPSGRLVARALSLAGDEEVAA